MKKILLLLILALGLFGAESQEIGVPLSVLLDDNFPHSETDSSILAPDGESFYTLANGLVTQVQLSSMKQVTSFKIDTNETSFKKGYRISVTSDNQNIIIYSREAIELWDIQTKKLLKTLKVKSKVGTNSKYGFITITEEGELKIWDEKSLVLLKSSTIKYEGSYDEAGVLMQTPPMHIIAIDNILVVNYDQSAIFFDLNTFEIVSSFYYSKYKYSGISRCDAGAYIYAVAYTRSSSCYVDKKEKNELLLTSLSRRSSLSSRFSWFTKAKLDNQERGQVEKIIYYQFGNEWLLEEKNDGGFMGSENIKKYLKMKTKDGKIVPMNDATFKKYNKQINLKD